MIKHGEAWVLAFECWAKQSKCVFEVSPGSDVAPKASAELLEHDGGVLRRWLRGVEEDLAGAAAAAERRAVVRAAEKRAREDKVARNATKKARGEGQAEAMRV